MKPTAASRKTRVWLFGVNIAEYPFSHALNHEPKRRRKLLMHRREIRKFAGQAFEKGLTLVPLKMYFKEGRAKVLLGICRGKQKHDKRESIKERDTKREIDRAMRREMSERESRSGVRNRCSVLPSSTALRRTTTSFSTTIAAA